MIIGEPPSIIWLWVNGVLKALNAFMQDLGVPDSRARTISFGEERPLDPGNDEAAWAKNRRAHFEFD